MSKKIQILIFVFQLLYTAVKAQDIFEIMNDTAMVKTADIPYSAPPILDRKWNHLETKYFTLNLGLAMFLDHNILQQDDQNIQQVGKVGPATEFRADRIIVSGKLNVFKYPWRYLFSANYNGLDVPDSSSIFSVIDLNIEIPFGERGGWITIGKQKEGVGHEYVLPGSQGMFTERASGVPAFIKQRNTGIRYSNSVLKNRMTYTFGVFNNWIEKGNKNGFAENGIQLTSRITALPYYLSDRNLMHVGIGWRYSDAPKGKLSYKARPEANSAPYFLNTGSFAAYYANTLMVEWIGVKGPVALIGEYMNTFVKANTNGNPSFNYWQFGGSWFLTGENRNYNKQTGNMGKLIPKKMLNFKKGGGLGAVELGARYTKSNFMSGLIDGGKFGRFTTALSWYPNVNFRFELNYGHGKLEKNALVGNADFWQFRAQIEL